MIDLNALAKQCFENAKRRGKITDETTKRNFCIDVMGEVFELDRATPFNPKKENLLIDIENSKNDTQLEHRFNDALKDYEPNEISDIICTMLSYCHIKGYDIERFLKLTVHYNSIRK